MDYFFIVIVIGISSCLLWERFRHRKASQLLIQQVNRERLVYQFTRQIRQFLDLESVMAAAVQEVQSFLKADRVLIYRLWDDGTGSAIHETVLPSFPSVLGQTFPEEVFPFAFHYAYSLGKVRAIANIHQADVENCLADFVKQFGVQAKLVVPIIQDRSHSPVHPGQGNDGSPYLWGLLIAHQCGSTRHWQDWEVELMKQIATQVAIAIQQSALYHQLQQINDQLEQRVQQRTAELATTNLVLTAEITERQNTELALRHSNDTLRALITASPRAILMLDVEGMVKIWNPAAEQMFGWSHREVIDHPTPIQLDEPREGCLSLQESVLQGKTFTRIELRRSRKDNTPIDVIFSAAPLRETSGQISGIVAVITDITEQKQRAEQLRLLQSVVVNTSDAVIITEATPINKPGPRIIYVNEAFTRTTGYTPEEVIGKTPRILQGIKTDQQELQKIRTALSRWESITAEVINYRKDGTEYWNEFNIVPVADINGSYTHWIAVQRDTTARRRADEVRMALEKEKELNILKARFFSMASHEFRTPLSIALAAAQVLENSQDEWNNREKRLRNLGRIQDSVKKMVQLLDDILTISRAESKNLTFKPQFLDLEQCCHHLMEEFELGDETLHLFTFECHGIPYPMYLDEKLMHSALTNLVSNAVKYSPYGGMITIRLIFAENTVQVQVQDQGIGILPEDQVRLFEPFYRGKNSHTIQGTGLGLVVVQKCIELHQGKIEFLSQVGLGTTCTVTLPKAR